MNQADIKFLKEMVMHHEIAIKMSENILKTGEDLRVKTMASEIITDQKEEINEMNIILSETREYKMMKAINDRNKK